MCFDLFCCALSNYHAQILRDRDYFFLPMCWVKSCKSRPGSSTFKNTSKTTTRTTENQICKWSLRIKIWTVVMTYYRKGRKLIMRDSWGFINMMDNYFKVIKEYLTNIKYAVIFRLNWKERYKICYSIIRVTYSKQFLNIYCVQGLRKQRERWS